MGKKLFQEIYASQDRTDALGLPELMVVSEQDDKETMEKVYHAVHRSYFGKAKVPCPYCAGSNTTETKIRPRKYKDILPSKDGKTGVIDLIFHQRYFRCDDCNRVFHEDIDFSEEGCRYTNRLSDLLADGTLTKTYEKVCKDYGVPASKASVGVIMRRRLRMRIEQLPPDERATDAEYRARLAVCAECAELQNGICAQCGCFAELRAAKSAAYCPLRNW